MDPSHKPWESPTANMGRWMLKYSIFLFFCQYCMFWTSWPGMIKLLYNVVSNLFPGRYLYLLNSFGFQKPLVMRTRIAYKLNNRDVLEEGQINNFPRDLWGLFVHEVVNDFNAQALIILVWEEVFMHRFLFFISEKLLLAVSSDTANLLFSILLSGGTVGL